ncbi:MAG: MBL fold metallo-hydrolase, partial [Oceanospirillaceae bacterium]|nr:MBL fold metallo-hydrolase [Oceanospirillaceae bacterium]
MKSFFFKVFIVISCCSSNLVGAQETSKIMIEATHVAGNVSVLMGVGGFSGGNVGVSAGEDGLLIIDDKLAPMSEKLEAKLAAMNK